MLLIKVFRVCQYPVVVRLSVSAFVTAEDGGVVLTQFSMSESGFEPESSLPPKCPRTEPDPVRLHAPLEPGSEQAQGHIGFSLAHARSKVALLINPLQVGNPMLRYVTHVRKEIQSAILADFVCGPTTCVLFLSLQYHILHPEYIYGRVRALGKTFKLRVLLVLADVSEHRRSLHELTSMALINGLTLVCAGSEREAARYLETFRSYDSKTADSIQERVNSDYPSRLNAALSSIRGVNKTDVSTLAFTFGAFRNLATVSEEQLRECPGIGERKVARLYAALNQPFKTDDPWTGQGRVDDDDGDIS